MADRQCNRKTSEVNSRTAVNVAAISGSPGVSWVPEIDTGVLRGTPRKFMDEGSTDAIRVGVESCHVRRVSFTGWST